MAILVQPHTNISKQATLLDGVDIGPLKWQVCGSGLNRFVHEGMNHISNVKVHFKTHGGNLNINVRVTCEVLVLIPYTLTYMGTYCLQ